MGVARTLYPLRGSYCPETMLVEGQFAIGAAGAITAGTTFARGVESITKEATAGKYTVVLTESFTRLMGMSLHFKHSAAVAVLPQLDSEDVATEANRTVVVQFYNTSGAAADAPSGSSFFFHLRLAKTSLPLS